MTLKFYMTPGSCTTGINLPPRCAAHYQLIRARPVVQRLLREKGYR
jgi:glutathione S-transferase